MVQTGNYEHKLYSFLMRTFLVLRMSIPIIIDYLLYFLKRKFMYDS